MKEEGIFSLEKIHRIETVFASKKKKKERKKERTMDMGKVVKHNKTKQNR